MEASETKCFDIYRECLNAIHEGVLIRKVSSKDKEFHFQNWCQSRLHNVGLHFERSGRNIYPDFCLVERPEGYEIKGLTYPGRDKDFDANSNIPSGYHNGRNIFMFSEDIPTIPLLIKEVVALNIQSLIW